MKKAGIKNSYFFDFGFMLLLFIIIKLRSIENYGNKINIPRIKIYLLIVKNEF